MKNIFSSLPGRFFKASDIDEHNCILVTLTSFNTEKPELDAIYRADEHIVLSFFQDIAGKSIGEIGDPIPTDADNVADWIDMIASNTLENSAGRVVKCELISRRSSEINSGILPIWTPCVKIALSKKALNLINSLPDMSFYFGIRSLVTPSNILRDIVKTRDVEKICGFSLSAAPEYIPDEKGTEELNKIKESLADKMEIFSIPNRIGIHTLVKAREEGKGE